MEKVAQLERQRAEWKRVFREAWLAGDTELEELAATQLTNVGEAISRELRRIETADE